MIYCLNPDCPNPHNPDGNVHCQNCGVPIALRNRFKALRPIGQGGFGTTYLAEDLDNRRKQCVVKRLTYRGSSTQATEKAQHLFEQEAERLDQLTHPQIPRLLAYFEERNYLYLVQEFIEGQTLQAELAQEGPFDEAKIRHLLHGLLPILQFVHSRSVIHRDLKPDNIMRRAKGDQAGELVLIDFGVAKLLAQSGIVSRGTTIGTPGYAAPEQMQGRATPSSDLFALGATCFQLLTQSFEDGKTSLIGHGWVKNWRQAVKQPLSDELANILTNLLALEERKRYPTATAVLRDLSPGSLAGHPVGLSPAIAPGLMSTLPTVVAQPAAPAAGITPQAKTPQPKTPQPQRPISPAAAPLPVASPAPQPQQPLPPTVASLPPQAFAAKPGQPAPIQPSPAQPAPVQPVPSESSSGQPTSKKVAVGTGFWFKYGLLSYVGQSLGFLLAMVVTAFLATKAGMDPETQMTEVLNMLKLMYWLVGGFVVGMAQWIALRKWLPSAFWWVPATVAMYWAIALVRVTIGSPSWIPGMVVGAALAIPQWWVLNRHKSRSYWWILWLAPMMATLFRLLNIHEWLDTITWGLVAPMLDGVFLLWILKRNK
ncbi:MAG: protein kinase [Cyanobacteria bacterium P01_F01_bin.53]